MNKSETKESQQQPTFDSMYEEHQSEAYNNNDEISDLQSSNNPDSSENQDIIKNINNNQKKETQIQQLTVCMNGTEKSVTGYFVTQGTEWNMFQVLFYRNQRIDLLNYVTQKCDSNNFYVLFPTSNIISFNSYQVSFSFMLLGGVRIRCQARQPYLEGITYKKYCKMRE